MPETIVENPVIITGGSSPNGKAVPPKSVTIMGKSNNGGLCPWDAEEIWGINNVAGQPEYAGKRFDKLFAFDLLPQEYTDGMKKYAPICSWQPYADIKYPINEIIAEFKTRYFNNTICYALAYAAYLRVPQVSIYGVDVSFGAPYAQENRGVEYWIGRAQERGVAITVPDSSCLLRTVYGNMYGEVDHCNMLLYLHERINLLNVLPREGTYSEALKAQNAHWVLFPKSDEAEAHNLKIMRDPAGIMSFECPQEFTSDVQMPPETWEYLRGRLRELDKAGKLPFGVISAYEKLCLSKPEGGN